MKSFEVFWKDDILTVRITDEKLIISFPYKKYSEICKAHDWKIMPSISKEYAGYFISDEWLEPNYVKDKTTGETLPFTNLSSSIRPAILAIENIETFIRENNFLQENEDFYLYYRPVTHHNITPSCNIL